MKRLLLTIALLFPALGLFVFPPTAEGQTTLVTGTIKDPNNLPYSFASVKMQLVLNGAAPPGTPTVTVNNAGQCSAGGFGSAPCQIPIATTQGPISTDATGTFTASLADNSLVTPAGTKWLFTVTEAGIAPPLGTGSQTFSLAITISGASQSVSVALSAVAPALSNLSGSGTVASGTATLGTLAIASSACATTVTAVATGVLSTDNVQADFNADPTSTVGYIPGAMLTIIKWPSANQVNFKVCNNTANSITPAAITLNWRVAR